MIDVYVRSPKNCVSTRVSNLQLEIFSGVHLFCSEQCRTGTRRYWILSHHTFNLFESLHLDFPQDSYLLTCSFKTGKGLCHVASSNVLFWLCFIECTWGFHANNGRTRWIGFRKWRDIGGTGHHCYTFFCIFPPIWARMCFCQHFDEPRTSHLSQGLGWIELHPNSIVFFTAVDKREIFFCSGSFLSSFATRDL